MILDISGGVVTNAVPGEAWAVVRADAAALPAAERITVEDAGDGTARIDATGVNAHAAWPERGISAIMLLANYLLENGLCNQQEREFLELVQSLVSDTTGAGVGIATADEYFGPLTVVGGTIRKEGDRLVQTMDSRWPTSITAEEITAALTKLTDNIGATFENTLLMVPFLVKPDDSEIQVLQDAFQFVTGDTEHKPFTIGGGTYAREFKKGASFGVNMPWIENPDWVGGEHGPGRLRGPAEDFLQDLRAGSRRAAGVEDRVEALLPRPCFPGPAFAAGPFLRLGVGRRGHRHFRCSHLELTRDFLMIGHDGPSAVL